MRRWVFITILLALAMVAARPLLTLQFFKSDDGLQHLLRLFAFDRTIHQGVVYPRWIFDLVFGKLRLGAWQSVLLVERNGPRERDLVVTVVPA